MGSRCHHCNNIIRTNWITYKAFDSEYCSNMCRNEKVKIIKIIDPKYNDHVKWQPIIRRSQSSINIDIQDLEEESIELEKYFLQKSMVKKYGKKVWLKILTFYHLQCAYYITFFPKTINFWKRCKERFYF